MRGRGRQGEGEPVARCQPWCWCQRWAGNTGRPPGTESLHHHSMLWETIVEPWVLRRNLGIASLATQTAQGALNLYRSYRDYRKPTQVNTYYRVARAPTVYGRGVPYSVRTALKARRYNRRRFFRYNRRSRRYYR